MILSHQFSFFFAAITFTIPIVALPSSPDPNTASAKDTLIGTPDGDFESTLRAGILFLHENGIGPEYRIRSMQVMSRQRTGSRRAGDFTKFAISLEDTPRLNIVTTKNYQTARRVWSPPEHEPASADVLSRVLALFDQEVMTVPFRDAVQKAIAAGSRGPWQYVQVIAHPFVKSGTEPFYSFRPVNTNEEIVWIGSITGGVLGGRGDNIVDLDALTDAGQNVAVFA